MLARRMADPNSRDGSSYGTTQVRAFVDALHAGHDGALASAFDAPAREAMPQIQVSPSEGRALSLLAMLIAAERAVEIGTLAGYSAIQIARGMRPNGKLWTLENEPRHAAVARANIERAGLARRIEVVEGDAGDRLGELEVHAPFDLVFLDADKGRYDLYARWATRHLREGGVLVADNAYFFGRLLEDSEDAEAMRRFHRETAASLDTACLPTPDGLLLAIKRVCS
jgi:caffeoyl-CoA O-methyltransferase